MFRGRLCYTKEIDKGSPPVAIFKKNSQIKFVN